MISIFNLSVLPLSLRSLPKIPLVFPIFSTLSSISLSSSGMEENPPSLLVLSGKSSSENELALSLRNSSNLKLLDGHPLSILLRSEMHTPSEDDQSTFQIESYMDTLSTERFGRFLIWSPRMPSTHDLVSQNFCELPLYSVCVTDIQFKGRGRSKNAWDSPIGCLMFSFTLQMENGHIVPLLQYVVSLAMTEAIRTVCEKIGLPHLDVKIKWPNDLYLNGLKVGGILCTSTYKSKKFNVSAGIGLNVDNEKPTTCLNAMIRKLNSTYQLKREHILAEFFNKFEILFDVFMSQGFQALEDLYYKTWLHSGQKVVIEERNEGQSIENIVVTIQGLTPSGYLLAIGEDNNKYELHPDGNSFDFFKGLVRRKVQ